MKLYYSPGTSSLLPHIVLVEAGLAFDTVKIDLHTKAMDAVGDYRDILFSCNTAGTMIAPTRTVLNKPTHAHPEFATIEVPTAK